MTSFRPGDLVVFSNRPGAWERARRVAYNLTFPIFLKPECTMASFPIGWIPVSEIQSYPSLVVLNESKGLTGYLVFLLVGEKICGIPPEQLKAYLP